MSMKIRNNNSAGGTIGKLKKNEKALAKQIRIISTGMRLNGAGDGTADYVISERMKARIRALDQDTKNVQTGASLLRTAEGAIQEQLELLKTVKAKVIDADNDSNTDQDRVTIQKEIRRALEQINDIAYETTYNGKKLLLGGDILLDQVEDWEVLDKAILAPESDSLGLIPDLYNRDPYVSEDDTMYDKFKEYEAQRVTLPSLGLNSITNQLTGGSAVTTPKVITMNLSACDVSALNNNDAGVGFWINVASNNNYSYQDKKKYFVLTKNPSTTFHVVTGNNTSTTATNVAVNSSMTKFDIANAMASAINSACGTDYLSAAADGENVVVTTTNKYDSINYANRCSASGFQSTAGTVELYTYETVYHNRTGVFSTYDRLSGGQIEIRKTPDNPDAKEQEAVASSITRNVSGVTSGSGIRISGKSYATLTFVDGAGGLSDGTIGKNYNGTARIAGLNISMDGNGTFKLYSDLDNASILRNYYVYDGLSTSNVRKVTGTVEVGEVKSLTGSVGAEISSVASSDSEKVRASYKLDLSSYTGQYTAAELEDLISALKGNMLNWNYRTSESSTGRASKSWEFIDTHGDRSPTTGTSRSVDAQSKFNDNATLLDLNELRNLLAGSSGSSVADVMGSWLQSKLGTSRIKLDSEGNALFQANLDGKSGNDDYLQVLKGTLRSYEIDLANGLADVSIPAGLDGKGFRVYCATHHGQWFNFAFYNGSGSLDEKPESGTDTEDIKTIMIDVSQVRNANELAAAIYDQSMPLLTSGDPYYDHYIRMGADTVNGKLTIYDSRRYNVNTSQFEYQIDGAKIADGIYDNVVKSLRDIYANDVVVHHTDHASQNIHLKIARTTMDHIFGKMPDDFDISKYDVLTVKNREKLLGNMAGKTRRGLFTAEEEGLLDKGIRYLTNANTLIGAQIRRLEMTEEIVVTNHENTQASESTYRDADMAKEMVNFTKASILAQSSQSMLIHSNQDLGHVMGLLE